jgi:16S rRNA (cytosine1407-C5)-methyltransferase
MIKDFTNSINEIYKDNASKVIAGLKQVQPTTFRINRCKADPNEVITSLQNLGYVIRKGPLENSYYFENEPNGQYISDTEPFKNGQIYIQEFSSMIPPILLDPKPNDYILDISAAPGSKTTQIADIAKNEAKIVAIERNPIRIKTLEHNIALQGSKEIRTLLGNGIKFDKRHPEFVNSFDKVLVDAPCSSEGQINLNNPNSYKYWKIYKRKEMSKIQKGLLIAGFRMLRKRGTLVYSTCTFGVEENELVLDWFMDKVKDEAKIEKITLPFDNTLQGKTIWEQKKLHPSISNSKRILPNKYFTGFFVAKIIKV